MDKYEAEKRLWFGELAERAGDLDYESAVQYLRLKAPSRYPSNLTTIDKNEVYALCRFLSSVGNRQGKDKGTLDCRRYVTILWDDNIIRGFALCEMVTEMFRVHCYLTPYIIWKNDEPRLRVMKLVVMFREEEAKKQLETAMSGERLSNGYKAFRQMLLMGVS